MLKGIRNIVLSLFLVLIVAAFTSAGEAGPITAVAATGSETTCQISTIAARAPYFLLFDGQNRLLSAEKNPYLDAGGGAGTKSADFLAQKNVSTVIAGQFGRKMMDRLQVHNIKAVVQEGRVIDAIKEQNNE